LGGRLAESGELDQIRSVASAHGLSWPMSTPDSVRELLKDRLHIFSNPSYIAVDADRRIVMVGRTRESDLQLRGDDARSEFFHIEEREGELRQAVSFQIEMQLPQIIWLQVATTNLLRRLQPVQEQPQCFGEAGGRNRPSPE
jgi:hypothetical protein